MPTYDLQCESCDHDFEVFRQGFLRDEDRVCPECGASARQLITGFVACRSSSQVAGAGAASGGGGHSHGASCGCGHGH